MWEDGNNRGQDGRGFDNDVECPWPVSPEAKPSETVTLHGNAPLRLDDMAAEVSRRINQWREPHAEQLPEDVSRRVLVETLLRLCSANEDVLNYAAMVMSRLSFVPNDVATRVAECANHADRECERIARRNGVASV
jgi:hypothetical protein